MIQRERDTTVGKSPQVTLVGDGFCVGAVDFEQAQRTTTDVDKRQTTGDSQVFSDTGIPHFRSGIDRIVFCIGEAGRGRYCDCQQGEWKRDTIHVSP
ncbi:hypothetical protein D3C87_1612520 [compost metagenome]